MKLNICFCVLVSIVTCCSDCAKLEDVNYGVPISRSYTVESLQPCPSSDDIVPKKIFLTVRHESNCVLDSFYIAVYIEFKCVYYGLIDDPIVIPINTCKENRPLIMQLVVVDVKGNKEYWWENKRAYHFGSFNKMTCTLLDADNFDTDGVEFEFKVE